MSAVDQSTPEQMSGSNMEPKSELKFFPGVGASFASEGPAAPEAEVSAHRPETHDAPRLADHLLALDVHPVLLVGTNESGKTTMLQSLIYFMRKFNTNRSIDIRLGSNVFPPGYADAKIRHQNAEKFYNFDVTQFGKKVSPEPTQIAYPFFVPIDLLVTVNGVTKTYKFAFYEGMGEWFEKDGGEKSSTFKQFRPEFTEIVTKFTNPLSIIFLAPSVDGGIQTREYAHLCLDNAITEFHRQRIDSNRDHALLLLTKWDQLFSPSDPKGHFSDASPENIVRLMQSWEFIWPKFRGVKLEGPRAKSLMPYAACWTGADGKIVPPGGRYQHIFDKFNRTIWNWLYMNIVDAERDVKNFDRRVIFEDVVQTEEKANGAFLKLLETVLWA